MPPVGAGRHQFDNKGEFTMVTAVATPDQTDLGGLTPEEFVALLRQEVSQPGCGMTNHPLVQELEAGTATREQLLLLCEQFYLHIVRMLPWIGAMYTSCPDEAARAVIVGNLAEETLGVFTHTKAHPDHLLDFAEALGADIEAMKGAEQLPESRRLTEYFEFMGMCRPWYVGFAAIGIGLESLVPDTFARIVPALKENYDMTDDQIVFWSLHVAADVAHGNEAIDLISQWAITPEARKQVYDGTIETGRLFYEMWNLYKQAA
jgi:pyrroloquinoline-quinone synthase